MKKVFVFSNLASSIDGKIATEDRGHFYLGTPEDRRQMQRLRRRADAVLLGASTLRSFKKPLLTQGAKTQPWNVLVSSRLEGLSHRLPFFQSPKVRRLIFVSPAAPAALVKKFSALAEIVVLRKGPLSIAHQILRACADRGIRNLLVEGGGGIMWEFARKNAIDEYHVTITPKIVGGAGAPTMVDGEGFSPSQVLGLKLSSCRRVGDELYLIYQRRR
ncbi:RibD family protein [bacterium]|nr:RibD family protein [bacterium]